MEPSSPEKANGQEKGILILSIFIAGLCSIIYELLISTASSYFLGDSIKYFSMTIGIYMASMGLGSFLSRSFNKDLLYNFILVELFLSVAGGISIPFLYFAYAYLPGFYNVWMFLAIILIGVLTGFEVPLLTRIMERYYTLKVNLSNVLSLDYLGALIATLLFPFLLLPWLGTFQCSLVFGMINLGLGGINLWVFREELGRRARRRLIGISGGLFALLLAVLLSSSFLLDQWSSAMYEDRIVHAERTPYQKIIMTRFKNDVRLYLDGNLQFSSLDEYRYHETLVHIPMAQRDSIHNVLILGGGDGLVARELLKYDQVRSIRMVDLDTNVFRLARENPYLKKLNKKSLHSPRLNTIGADAFEYLEATKQRFDLIVADLPDPNNTGLARLYSRMFYELVHSRLNDNGIFVTQATSPFHANKAFWCIKKTMEQSRLADVAPFHYTVPSFGQWGFIMASKHGSLKRRIVNIPVSTRALTAKVASNTFDMGKDLLAGQKNIHISTLDRPRILDYYLEGWQYYY